MAMMELKDVKEAFLKAEEGSFENALSRLRHVHSIFPEDVEFVVEFWNEITWDLSYMPTSNTFGNVPEALLYRDSGSGDIVSAMSWLTFFVGHEIHDDGEAALVWLKATNRPEDLSSWLSAKDPPLEWTSVDPETEGSHPVLLRSRDVYVTMSAGVAYSIAETLTRAQDLRAAVEFVRTRNERIRRVLDDEPRGPSETLLQLQAVLRSFDAGIR